MDSSASQNQGLRLQLGLGVGAVRRGGNDAPTGGGGLYGEDIGRALMPGYEIVQQLLGAPAPINAPQFYVPRQEGMRSLLYGGPSASGGNRGVGAGVVNAGRWTDDGQALEPSLNEFATSLEDTLRARLASQPAATSSATTTSASTSSDAAPTTSQPDASTVEGSGVSALY